MRSRWLHAAGLAVVHLAAFEPGSGNFTKIVLRVTIDPRQPAVARLRPGLSTSVTVRLGS